MVLGAISYGCFDSCSGESFSVWPQFLEAMWRQAIYWQAGLKKPGFARTELEKVRLWCLSGNRFWFRWLQDESRRSRHLNLLRGDHLVVFGGWLFRTLVMLKLISMAVGVRPPLVLGNLRSEASAFQRLAWMSRYWKLWDSFRLAASRGCLVASRGYVKFDRCDVLAKVKVEAMKTAVTGEKDFR